MLHETGIALKNHTAKEMKAVWSSGVLYSGIYVYDAEGFYNSEDEVPVYYDIWGNKKYFGGVSCASPMSGKVGTYKIKDLNGDNMINGSDMYYAGTPQPKAHGDGLTRSVEKTSI